MMPAFVQFDLNIASLQFIILDFARTWKIQNIHWILEADLQARIWSLQTTIMPLRYMKQILAEARGFWHGIYNCLIWWAQGLIFLIKHILFHCSSEQFFQIF